MVEYESTIVYRDGVGHRVVKPKMTISYKDGIGGLVPEMDETLVGGPNGRERASVTPQPIRFGEGADIGGAIESALSSPFPEERALLPQLAEMKQKRRQPDNSF
jgi:hypothetical protein